MPYQPDQSHNGAYRYLNPMGGDCAGTLSFSPHNQKPPVTTDEVEIIEDKRLFEVIAISEDYPMLVLKGYRMALAGAQNKLAVGYKNGKVMLMKGGSLTTHIIKPNMSDFRNTTYNETFCMKLAQRVGIDAPNCHLIKIKSGEKYKLCKEKDGIFIDEYVMCDEYITFFIVRSLHRHRREGQGHPSGGFLSGSWLYSSKKIRKRSMLRSGIWLKRMGKVSE